MMGTMGKPATTGMRVENISMPADQAIYRERTTGFEPATLTLAKKREENQPLSPCSPLTWSPVRRFVRPARPVRSFRIPVYHRTCVARSVSYTSAT